MIFLAVWIKFGSEKWSELLVTPILKPCFILLEAVSGSLPQVVLVILLVAVSGILLLAVSDILLLALLLGIGSICIIFISILMLMLMFIQQVT